MKSAKPSQVVVSVGCLLLVAAIMFPPWRFEGGRKVVAFGPIWNPPTEERTAVSASLGGVVSEAVPFTFTANPHGIDAYLLGFEIVGIVLVTVGMAYVANAPGRS